MNTSADLAIAPAGGLPAGAPDAVVWHHRAFCRVALPVRAPSKGSWEREAAGVALAMEAGDGTVLPTGKFARLALMHLFDRAVRGGAPVVGLGDDPAVVAQRFGVDPAGPKLRDWQEQMARLLATHLTVAWDGRPPLSVFDARGRPRGAAPAWRAGVRMNARFHAGLLEAAVALDLGVLKAVAESTLALDLYAWLAAELPQGEGAVATVVGWDDLRGRFGGVSSQSPDFRAAFEQALLQVQQAWPQFVSVMRDDAVEFRCPSAPAPVAVPPPPVGEAPTPAVPNAGAAEAEDAEDSLAAELESELDLLSEPDDGPVAVQAPVPAEAGRSAPRQTISLKSHLTGLPQVIWLGRSNGRDNVVIEVTPGGRYDPENCTVIALEPVALQVVGGLYARDFERVAAWAAANRDLIDDWWDSQLSEFEEVVSRVKKVPAPAWR